MSLTTRRVNRKRKKNRNNYQPLRPEQVHQGGAGTQEVLTIKRRLLKLIVLAPHSLETVERGAFQEFVKAFSPSVEIPTKSVIRSLLLSTYRERKEQLRCTLASAEDMVLTCESWSYRAEDSFLSMSCHFVDSHGNLRSYMLSTVCLFRDDSADNIMKQLCTVMKDWGVEEKVQSVVRAGLPQLKGVKTKWRDMPCFADTLNVIFKDLMREDELAGVMRKCQNMVRFFKFDLEAKEKLQEIQKKLNTKQKDLNMNCGDHWFLWLDVLEQLLEQNDTMGMVFVQKSKMDLILDEDETEKVRNIISALKPLRKATAMMKTQGFQSVSVMLPLLKTFMAELRKEEQKGNHVAKMLLMKSKKEFGNISKHGLAVFTFLDPRWKNDLGEENRALALSKIRQELTAHQPSCSAAELDDLLHRYMAYEPTSKRSNPFSWWRNTGKEKFGELSRLALKKLGVVSTAVPLERAFSEAGEKFCKQRNTIEPENLNMILFLHTNWSTMQ